MYSLAVLALKVGGKVVNKWLWEQWVEPEGEILKMMTALLVREQIRVVLENHIYTANGKLYRQLKGGPIGLAVTTVLAETLMRVFDVRYKERLEEVRLDPSLRKRYVDDLDLAASKVEAGSVVIEEEGRLRIEVREGESNDEGDCARTARLYKYIANRILPKSVEMEEDIGSNHNDGYIPILDTKMKVINNKIRFKFYSKPMATKRLYGIGVPSLLETQ